MSNRCLLFKIFYVVPENRCCFSFLSLVLLLFYFLHFPGVLYLTKYLDTLWLQNYFKHREVLVDTIYSKK